MLNWLSWLDTQNLYSLWKVRTMHLSSWVRQSIVALLQNYARFVCLSLSTLFANHDWISEFFCHSQSQTPVFGIEWQWRRGRHFQYGLLWLTLDVWFTKSATQQEKWLFKNYILSFSHFFRECKSQEPLSTLNADIFTQKSIFLTLILYCKLIRKCLTELANFALEILLILGQMGPFCEFWRPFQFAKLVPTYVCIKCPRAGVSFFLFFLQNQSSLSIYASTHKIKFPRSAKPTNVAMKMSTEFPYVLV